jgi:hypothetical protein
MTLSKKVVSGMEPVTGLHPGSLTGLGNSEVFVVVLTVLFSIHKEE